MRHQTTDHNQTFSPDSHHVILLLSDKANQTWAQFTRVGEWSVSVRSHQLETSFAVKT